MEKIRIVCFGDSNTWGYNPRTKNRFPESVRWTGLLQQNLGECYQVIEEGQNGRTIASDDPCEGDKNGMLSVIPCIESQKPFDLLILMLGSNDLKRKFNYASIDVAGEMQLMLEKILAYTKYHMEAEPKILLVSPPYVGEGIRDSWLGDCFGYERAIEVSHQLAPWYQELAKMYRCDFLDAALYAKAGTTDSLHMEEDGHENLANVLTAYVQKLFAQ